ncbi:MAG: S8 family serine peptidase [Gemmatimonadota bacterium]
MVGSGGIDLVWMDNSVDEDGFAIERRLGQTGTFAEIAQVGADVTTYSDVGLIPETEYCYQVRAFNAGGNSGYTNISCATTEAANPGECVDTGNHDDLTELWNISKVKAHLNLSWKANQRPGCELRVWYFGLDSGVDSDHPDLNVVEIRNFVVAEPGATGEDGNGHGTHTAGSAAARDGNGGVVGVAPGAPVFGFRVCSDDGSCSFDDIIAGVDEVTARKLADPSQPMVANLSLAGPVSDIMDTAIRRTVNAGVIVAVAAGNGLLGACLIPDDAKFLSPARTGDDAINASNGSDGDNRRVNGTMTVTASNASDADGNCNFGNAVTVAAPGIGIKSTWLNGGFNTISGTSMATPHVSGAAILFLQSQPNATPAQVEQAIVNRLDPWTTNEQPNASGRLNVETL